jgi:tellurite resistance protein TehA-like permease
VTIGSSIVLIAVGAILYFAVTADIQGIELQTVGLILLLLGILGLVLGLVLSTRRRRTAAPVERETVVERQPPPRDPRY